MKKKILVTGGAGFIGSHLVRHLVNKYPDYLIVNYDKLTYAGNLENLVDIEKLPNYIFIKGDIMDKDMLHKVLEEHNINNVIHLAAESHVDRSISNPIEFVNTNVVGTVVLLNTAVHFWKDNYEGKLFYHVSTDEVFGSLGDEGFFTETTPYDPRSPYSSSKASSDHFVRAYFHTYKLPVMISNCSNNYGPFQFPEKLLPLMINNILNKKPLPIYGKGENIRDWLYVVDHAKAIDLLFHKGNIGETYCVGGNNEWQNIELVKLLCQIMDKKLNRETGESKQLITYVKDRAGHDLRYAIDTKKIFTRFGWKPEVNFEKGLEKTVDWYLENSEWLKNVTSGNYMNYYKQQYADR